MNRYYITEPKSLTIKTHIVEAETLEEGLKILYPKKMIIKGGKKYFPKDFNVIHVEYDINTRPTQKFK